MVLYPNVILSDTVVFKDINLKEVEGGCKKGGAVIEFWALQHSGIEQKGRLSNGV